MAFRFLYYLITQPQAEQNNIFVMFRHYSIEWKKIRNCFSNVIYECCGIPYNRIDLTMSTGHTAAETHSWFRCVRESVRFEEAVYQEYMNIVNIFIQESNVQYKGV